MSMWMRLLLIQLCGARLIQRVLVVTREGLGVNAVVNKIAP